MHFESFQVEVLFTPQVGHGELAYRLNIVCVARTGDVLVLGIYPVASRIGLGDINNVLAAIAVFRPECVVG